MHIDIDNGTKSIAFSFDVFVIRWRPDILEFGMTNYPCFFYDQIEILGEMLGLCSGPYSGMHHNKQ